MAAHVEQEEQMEASKYKLLTLTRSWIIRRGPFKTSLWPVTYLLWAYQKTTKVYTYGVIRVGKFSGVVIVNRSGQKIEVSMPQEKVEALISQLAQRAPWAFFGYSNELAHALQKDLAGFVTAVDTRRQQLSAKSQPAKSST